MTRPTTLGRTVRAALFGAVAVTSLSIVGGGCLDRPVAPAVPVVNARVVERAKQNKVSKIDLLFMIDNSSSMADKQTILAAAVPDLVNRLVNPVCINPMTGAPVGIRNPDGSCTTGEPDFDPVKDIHIGIITSSLGSHGAALVCDDAQDLMRSRTNPHNNDKAHLVARTLTDTPVATFENKGFLNWAGGTPADALNQIITPFTSMIQGVGQHGCGYEASLEAIYRFLVDPDPYDSVVVDPPGSLNGAQLVGTDMVLLQQRKDFLRPDSLVAIIAVSDENDCSIVDGGQGYFAIIPSSGGKSVIPRGTSACLTNPNDPCCFNCGLTNPPSGCTAPGDDAECAKGPWTKVEDQENLRCWQQKRKYGQDFLYPVQRYIDGLTLSQVPNRNNMPVKNPLYSDLQCDGTGCAAERDHDLVFLAGLVGVPWQDIANDPNSPNLLGGYKTAKQISDENIWDKIVGHPGASPPTNPTDPHMIESIVPRAGLPGTGSAYNADPIHGHEWDPSKDPQGADADLQYACIFPLSPAKDCAGASDCDCSADAMSLAAMASPLCQQTNGTYSTLQGRAKAYPGIRELQLLQGLGEQAIVASICPATLNTAAPDYGYRPAIAALISRLRNALRGRCLPRTIELIKDPLELKNTVPCVIVEAYNPANGGPCVCDDKPGRVIAAPEIVTDEVKTQGSCYCELTQLQGGSGDLQNCQYQATIDPMTPAGWCYVDPSQGSVDQCPIVANCPATARRIIRFVNPDSEPRPGATAFIMCQEKSFDPALGGAQMDPCAM